MVKVRQAKADKKKAKQKVDTKKGRKNNRRCRYKKEDLNRAVQEALAGKSIASVSQKYKVPESTVRARKMGKYPDKRPGPATTLSETEENELVEWAFHCSRRGFPITKNDLIESVKLICDNDGRKTPFANNRPGRSWLEGFMRRHPNLVQRVSENLSLNRAKVSEYKLKSWFLEVHHYLDEENLLSIHPSRVFNADETGVPMNPKPPAVLAPKGSKNVYNIVNNNEKENVTVLVTANAAGVMAPPLILFAGKSVSKEVVQSAPSSYSFGFSDNGWMTAKNFYEYIANVFHPWLIRNGIQLPIILYIDGHSSHITLPLSKFCKEKKIVLIALYPNATQILQPLDVSFFRPMKVQWQKSFQSFCKNCGTISIKRNQFAIILKQTFDSLDLEGIMQNGFRTCGLFPLDENAIDYQKVFKRLNPESANGAPYDSEDALADTENVGALTILETLIEKGKLQLFKANKTPMWTGNLEDKTLFETWWNLAQSGDSVDVETFDGIRDANESEISLDQAEFLLDLRENADDAVPRNDVGNIDDMIIVLPTDNKTGVSSEEEAIFELLLDSHGNITEEIQKNFLSSEFVSAPLPEKSKSSPAHTEELDGLDSLPPGVSRIRENIAMPELIPKMSPELSQKQPAPSETAISEPSESQRKCIFQDVTNSYCDQEQAQCSSDSFKKLLFWPNFESSNRKKKNDACATDKISVLSGPQWIAAAEAKENEKRLKADSRILKTKIKIEKQEFSKKQKEVKRARMEEEKMKKEQLRLAKEKEKIFKQQTKIELAEFKQKKREQMVLERLEAAEIEKKIAELQERQAAIKLQF